MGELSDSDLVHAAQGGDAGSLGVLLQRHQAGMRAVALSVLGHRHDVDDAVQESCLIAMSRLGDLREPQAVGGWLRTVVRNQARLRLRSRAAVPVPDLDGVLPASTGLDPAELLERQALGNWLWHAVDLLSPEQRLAVMLRYFTAVSSYEQIAAISGVPVGTVRSRLNHARARLTEHLLASADAAHGDHQNLSRTRQREAEQTLEAGRVGKYAEAMAAFCLPSIEMIWGKGKRTYGYDYPAYAMHRDVGDGVEFRLANVVVGPDVMIWETDLISPPEDPLHCPPSAVWLHSLAGGRTSRIRLLHSARNRSTR